MNVRLFAVACFASVALAACATQPRPLQGEFNPITPRDAAQQESTGAVVRWGGRIVQVEPRENRTCFEIISTRLTASGRPYWAEDDTGGRFIACRDGFYDPAIFEKHPRPPSPPGPEDRNDRDSWCSWHALPEIEAGATFSRHDNYHWNERPRKPYENHGWI